MKLTGILKALPRLTILASAFLFLFVVLAAAGWPSGWMGRLFQAG